jgi:hypothetical protein
MELRETGYGLVIVPDKYNISVATYNQSGFIDVIENCNGFTFTNLGDTIAEVNGMVVFPSATPATDLGDSRSIGGNQGEIYSGNIKLSFRAPVGAAPLIEIAQKFFVK